MHQPAQLSRRPALSGDDEAIRELVFDIMRDYGLTPDPSGVDADVDDIDGRYLSSGGMFEVLVDTEGAIVGTVGIAPVDDSTCELRRMYLRPAARGHGHGRALLERALAWAREHGYRRVELETATALVEAIGLYQRYGFLPIEKPASGCSVSQCDRAFALELSPSD